jgi:acetoin utilization deacetylase AcuC-like enzyme
VRHSRDVPIVYHPEYGTELAIAEHDHERAKHILTFLLSEGIATRRTVHRPGAAPLNALRRVHSDEYLASLDDPAALLPVVGFPTTSAQRDRFVETQRLAVGGTMLAARLAVARGGIALHLGGGFHHASSGRGSGFCVFNDVAVAVAEQRARGLDAPIVVVDLDLHDGDGTREIFADDPTVHTFSIHNHDLGSPQARGSTSIALGDGVRDAEYLEALGRHLVPVLDEVRPGLVFYLAGTDPAADDRMGNWSVSAEGILARDRFVVSHVRGSHGSVAMVVLLAGGYGHSAWSHSARFFAWLLSGREVEPPPTEELILARYRSLERTLRSQDLVADRDGAFEFTDEDVLSSLTGQGSAGRLLGYYSKHGIELALERYGLFERLRALGYGWLRVELDLDEPGGQTIRVFGEDDREQPLMELRVRRDGSTAPPLVLLRVEWLMLQNPRAEFTHERARLPGQNHPGLGMLKDVVSMLVVLCERLGLDGIVFSPSHYHLAAQSPRLLRFLDPADEARFRAMRALLGALPLAEAARAVEAGRIVDDRTGESLRWRPAPMVVAVSERMKVRVEGGTYEDDVAKKRTELTFRLQRGSGEAGGRT